MKYIKIALVGILMITICNIFAIRTEAATVTDEETGYTYSKTGNVTSEFPNLNAIKTDILTLSASEKNYITGKSYSGTLSHYLVGGNLHYTIPGLRNTNVLGNNCATMVPQGICRMDNYILITAYDGIPVKKNNRKFNSGIGNFENKNSYLTRDAYNSVIYLLTVDGTYITTLVYNKACHMGGITYDGKYVWIAEDESGVSAISKTNILRAAEIATKKKAKSIKLSGIYKISLSKLSKASYCTYFDNKVWFGTFNKYGSGHIYGYSVSYSHGTPVLTPVRYIKAPRYTQGICFYKDNSNVYLAAATSYGRNNASKIYCYHLKDYHSPTERFYGMLQIICENSYKTITFPPMIEQISLNGVFLYGIFESGARPYVDESDGNDKTNYPIGYYCIFDAALIFK